MRDTWSTAGVNPLATDRRARLLARLKDELELGEDELARINAGLEIEFAAIRSAAAATGTASAQEDMREQARLRIAKVLRSVLSPEKYKRYEEIQRQRPAGPRRGTLWTYENGALWPHEVRLGLSDGTLTEIRDGLPEGANVVLRVREIAE